MNTHSRTLLFPVLLGFSLFGGAFLGCKSSDKLTGNTASPSETDTLSALPAPRAVTPSVASSPDSPGSSASSELGEKADILRRRHKLLQQEKQRRSMNAYQQAVRLYADGKWADAIQQYNESLDQLPDLDANQGRKDLIRHGIADCYFKIAKAIFDDRERTINIGPAVDKQLDRSLTLVPDHEASHQLKRETERWMDKVVREDLLDKDVLTKRTQNVTDLLRKGKELYQLKDYDNAEVIFENVLFHDKYNQEALHFLGKLSEKRYSFHSLEREAEYKRMMKEVRTGWTVQPGSHVTPQSPSSIGPLGARPRVSIDGGEKGLSQALRFFNFDHHPERVESTLALRLLPIREALPEPVYEPPYRNFVENSERVMDDPAGYKTVDREKMVSPTTGGLAPYPAFHSPDELWILVRPDTAPVAEEQAPPRAGLFVAHPDGKRGENAKDADAHVELPLQHTKVRADIAGILNAVHVEQQYENPFDEKIEVTYQFPLPTDAAVTEFLMTIGDRTIRGIIREKEEANTIYTTAVASGHVASLMTQERPNLFEQKVGNIEPGKRIDLAITYFNALQLVDGYYEFTFPTTIGPRYNPVGFDDGIGAMPHGQTHPIEPQPTTVTYLDAGQRSGHDIDLEIELNAGMRIRELLSPSHAIETEFLDESRRTIRLAQADRIPNRDFILRYRLAGDEVQTTFLWRDGKLEPDYFVALIQPPDDIRLLKRQARDMIFVVDCSGSMSGEPMAKVKSTMRKAIRELSPDDRFAIIRFSDATAALNDTPLPATPDNIARALAFIDVLEGHGGTEMMKGIQAAFAFPPEAGRQRIISFMTDGFIGNEAEIFKMVADNLGDARVFGFGVGSSPNRYFIEGLARHGRGAAAFVSLAEDPRWVVDHFYHRIAHAALMNPVLEWGGVAADAREELRPGAYPIKKATTGIQDVYPSRLPDLLPGRPILVTGRCHGALPTFFNLKGTVGGKEIVHRVEIDAARTRTDHAGLSSIWARKRLESMHHHEVVFPEFPIKKLTTDFSIKNTVLSKYTAFVAVDSANKTDANEPARPVQQPNAMPEGGQHDKTLGQVQPAPPVDRVGGGALPVSVTRPAMYP